MGRVRCVALSVERFQFVPLAWVAARPKRDGDYRLFVDRFWALRDGMDIAVRDGAWAATHRSKELLDSIDELPFEFEVRRVPVVYLRIAHSTVFRNGEYEGLDFRYILPREAP